MCKQPIPQVTDKDVKRIALRDFGEASFRRFYPFSMNSVNREWNTPSATRYTETCNGDLNKLTDNTKADGPVIQDIQEKSAYKRTVIDDDWRQYCEWLERE